MYNGDSVYSHDVQNEGLPNITGKVYAHLANSDAIYNEGAFNSRSNIGLRNLSAGNSRQSGYYNFDASASNSIFGSSNHVTTYNSAIQIWKRIS